MTYFIGISGKPGSVKARYRFKIWQELKYHGYIVQACSLAETLYAQINGLIDALHTLHDEQASEVSYRTLAKQHSIPDSERDRLFNLLEPEGLGLKHPDYGYSRRNPNMRKALSSYARIMRHEHGEDYWIEAMVNNVPSSVDFAIFTDLRFPNEADWLMDNEGMALRVEVDVEAIIAQYSDTGGYKYSREGMNDPTEVALDDYDGFYIRFEPTERYDRIGFGKEILDYYDLEHRITPEEVVRPVI